MKKQIITIAIILGIGLTALAQGDNHQGGMFQRGAEPREYISREEGDGPMLPSAHNQSGDAGAPLGSGIVALVGLGAAYLMTKKHREE